MLQFKIYINKITYIASVYLIKVEGGGVGSVKVFMSSMCVSRMVFVLSEVVGLQEDVLHNMSKHVYFLQTYYTIMTDICRKTKSHL